MRAMVVINEVVTKWKCFETSAPTPPLCFQQLTVPSRRKGGNDFSHKSVDGTKSVSSQITRRSRGSRGIFFTLFSRVDSHRRRFSKPDRDCCGRGYSRRQ